MITQGFDRTRRLLAALCALLLFTVQAPAWAAQPSVYLPAAQTKALLQTVQVGEHIAILKNGQAAPERGVPLDADTPRLVPTRLSFEPFHRVTPDGADQVELARPDLGFWACAPPDCRS